jgi:hypothetical protein
MDQFAVNWPILDTKAGFIPVGAGVTPPDDQLYDGALVVEPTTGKAWIAYKNPSTGLFSKSWLIYPWIAQATIYQTINNSFTGTPVLFNSPIPGNSINWDQALPNGCIVVPIRGIYNIILTQRADVYMAGTRFMQIMINGIAQYLESETKQRADEWYTVFQSSLVTVLNVGDAIRADSWQNSGINIGTYFWLTVELVSPV